MNTPRDQSFSDQLKLLQLLYQTLGADLLETL